ncbi:sporulation transcription factor Spo0A [Marinisporobacter balticus]|uniref:Stage 0 sporulation protein A homolog n=1 Tax=Marinisporobacter balticus TaxID=2018667 RepID=A0A4R2KBV5_9FIRM|nr:sporulation transcription factor Spo0A [Marinisporobacter balticus]TCO69547.1 two-component system response regulator (stage 0 sporulation protein A) [Marinisporobacter balticus]
MEKIKVLIIDDNKEACEILKEIISRQEDMEVVGIANNGKEAIQMIIEVEPDIMLLDIIMPHLDGLGVLGKLNKSRPKIMVISSSGQDNVTREAIRLGADYFLIKPIDINETVNRIRQIMKSSECSLNVEDSSMHRYRNNQNEFFEIEIKKIFFELGIPSHLKGFLYLKESIEMIFIRKELDIEMKTIYAYLAKKHSSNADRIRKDIRHAIESTWLRGNKDNIIKYFSEKPTNKEFISIIVQKLYL